MTRAALASIAKLHVASPPDYHPYPVCVVCDDIDQHFPCATRKLADEGLAGGLDVALAEAVVDCCSYGYAGVACDDHIALREALQRIVDMDYRGSPSPEQEIARAALDANVEEMK